MSRFLLNNKLIAWGIVIIIAHALLFENQVNGSPSLSKKTKIYLGIEKFNSNLISNALGFHDIRTGNSKIKFQQTILPRSFAFQIGLIKRYQKNGFSLIAYVGRDKYIFKTIEQNKNTGAYASISTFRYSNGIGATFGWRRKIWDYSKKYYTSGNILVGYKGFLYNINGFRGLTKSNGKDGNQGFGIEYQPQYSTNNYNHYITLGMLEQFLLRNSNKNFIEFGINFSIGLNEIPQQVYTLKYSVAEKNFFLKGIPFQFGANIGYEF